MDNNQHFSVLDLGRMGYAEALEVQEKIFRQILDHKKNGQSHNLNTLILVEHNPVYTLGKSGDLSNLKRTPEDVGAEFYKTSRGGDITYHGPGQLVGYPIFDLEHFEMGIAKYIWSIEQAIINTIKDLGIDGYRISDASGVWLDPETESVRKICALGVKASRYVTMHGFAFNINTDLTYFDHITPCGIDDKGVTSLEREKENHQDFEMIKAMVVQSFKKLFVRSI